MLFSLCYSFYCGKVLVVNYANEKPLMTFLTEKLATLLVMLVRRITHDTSEEGGNSAETWKDRNGKKTKQQLVITKSKTKAFMLANVNLHLVRYLQPIN